MDPLTAALQSTQPGAGAPLDAALLLSIFGAAVAAAAFSLLAARLLRTVRTRAARRFPAAHFDLPLARLSPDAGVARRAA